MTFDWPRTMAISDLVMPYMATPVEDKAVMAPLLAYRTHMKLPRWPSTSCLSRTTGKPAVKTILGTTSPSWTICVAKGVITARGTGGLRQKAGAGHQADINCGAASTQVSMDGRARRRAGKPRPDWDSLCRRQHYLCCSPTKCCSHALHSISPPDTIKNDADADRDDLLHHHAAGMLTLDGPLSSDAGRRAVLRQRQADGFRSEGGDARKTIVS